MDTKNITNSGQTRLVTGLILLAAAIVIVAIDVYSKNHFLVWLAMGVATYFAFDETARMVGVKDRPLYLYLCAGIVWFIAYFHSNPETLTFGALVVLLGFMAYKNKVDYKPLFMILYPLAPMLFLFSLPQSFGIEFLVWLVFIVGMTDTAAYYIGKSVGVTPFSAASPNKTWEGFYGGVVSGTILGVVFGLFLTSFWVAIIVSIFVSTASIFGDLFESYLKRCAGVKDSGNILPGHGGMLDRVDGYLFGGVVMVILLRILLN